MEISRITEQNSISESPYTQRAQNLTLPPGSLDGVLQPALRVLAARSLRSPRDEGKPLRVSSLLFAGDHSLALQPGVSAYPQEVTTQMMRNFQRGGACQNVLARRHCSSLTVVDVGVVGSAFGSSTPCSGEDQVFLRRRHVPTLLGESFPAGCRDPRHQPSLGTAAFNEAFRQGRIAAREVIQRDEPDLLILGEMGIGNTTPSAAIAEIITPSKHSLTGPGTGLDANALSTKKRIVSEIVLAFKNRQRQSSKKQQVAQLLSEVGGFEHAALAGAAFECASHSVHILLDGLIVTAALSPLLELHPAFRSWVIAAHLSPEPAHEELLKRYEFSPLLRLSLRLGEGSGAALAVGLLQDAVALIQEMATFSEAQISAGHENSVSC